MSDLLGILGALVVLVIPLLLAWRLLGRGERTLLRRRTGAAREKMPR